MLFKRKVVHCRDAVILQERFPDAAFDFRDTEVRVLSDEGVKLYAVVQAVDEPWILEALAQTGAVAALSLPENKGKLALFGGIKNARFRKQVTHGDVLTLNCELVEQRGPVGIGKASAYVDGKCAATAELTFVLT